MASAPTIEVECDSFRMTARNGRTVLELSGASFPAGALLPNFMSPTQTAAALKVSLRTLAKMRRQKNPTPCTLVAGEVRFDEAQVAKWAEGSGSPAARRANTALGSPRGPSARLFGSR